MPREGILWLICPSDLRWERDWHILADSFTAIEFAKEKIHELEKTLGPAPNDLKVNFMKD